MSLEAVTIAADWLADPDFGVNAVLPHVPHDPWDVPPPAVQVADQTRDGWVALASIPASRLVSAHALLVLQTEDGTFEPVAKRASTGPTHWGETPVVVLYAVRSAAAETATRYTKDILRAARGSLLALMEPAGAAARERNGVRLQSCTGFREVPLHQERGETLITGALVVTYTTWETTPVITP